MLGEPKADDANYRCEKRATYRCDSQARAGVPAVAPVRCYPSVRLALVLICAFRHLAPTSAVGWCAARLRIMPAAHHGAIRARLTELRLLTMDGVELGLTPIGNFLLIGREPITAEYLDRAEELASRLDAV